MVVFVALAVQEWLIGPQPTCDMSASAMPCAYYARLGWDVPVAAIIALFISTILMLVRLIIVPKNKK